MSLIERKKKTTPRYTGHSPKASRVDPRSFHPCRQNNRPPLKKVFSLPPTNHALSTPNKSKSVQDDIGGAASTYDSKNVKSPFQQRKSFHENQTPPSRHSRSPVTAQPERNNKSTISELSTPNFLRRGDHPPGGNLQDISSSPIPQSSPKRALPPSSERFHRGCNGMFSPGLGDTAEYETQVQNLRDEN